MRGAADQQHADYTAFAENHKEGLATWKDALIPYVDRTIHTLRIEPHLEPSEMVQFSVQFYLNSPERFLNAVGIQGKINNIKIKLFLCVVRLDNAIFRGIMTKINRDHHVMKYPAMRSEIRAWSVRAAWRVLEIQNLFNGKIPNFLMAAVVNTTARKGS